MMQAIRETRGLALLYLRSTIGWEGRLRIVAASAVGVVDLDYWLGRG